MRHLLIVGVDPGTTVGWAALNKKGEIISFGSRKGLTIDELTEIIRDTGKLLIVGTDKAKIPSAVRSISSRFRAPLVFPKKDLSKLEKKELIKGSKNHFVNDHEKDALAAAKFAFKKKRDLFQRINSYVTKHNKFEIEDKIIENVIKTKCSIVGAVQQIEQKEPVKEEKKEKIIEKTTIETVLRKENIALRKFISKLQERIRFFARKDEKNKEVKFTSVKPKPKEQVIMQKDQIIYDLRNDLENSKLTFKITEQREINLLKQIIDLDNKLILKCLPNLGMQSFERVKSVLKKNDVLYVEDANNFSEKAVRKIKKFEIDVIIHRKPLTQKVKKLLPFVFIPRKEVKLEIFDKIGFVEKKGLEKNKRLIFKKILREYQERRL